MTTTRPQPVRPTAFAGDDAAAAARGGASLLVLQTASKACALGFVLLLTRHVDRTTVGRYSTVAAIVVLANFLADFGTSPAITRSVSRRRDDADRLLSGTLLPSLLFGMVVAAAVDGFGFLAYRGPAVTDVVIASLAIPAASMLSSVLGALDGAGLIARRAVISTLQTVVIAFGIVPVLLGAGIRGAILSLVASPWLALLAASTMARAAGLWHSRLRFDVAQTRRLLRAALPFAITGGLTAVMLRFDVILLSMTRTPAETASYDLALRLLEAVAYPATAICGPLLFVVSRRLGAGDQDGAARAYREAARIVYVLGFPISVALLVLSRPILSVAFGPGYPTVALPLALMGAAQWLTFLVFLEGTLMLAGERAGHGTIVLAVCAGVTVLLDLLFVPRFGPTGAAAVMVVSWVTSVLLLHAYNARTLGIRTPTPHGAVMFAAGTLAALLFLLRNHALALSLSAGAMSYFAVLLATHDIDRHDVRRLRSALSGRG